MVYTSRARGMSLSAGFYLSTLCLFPTGFLPFYPLFVSPPRTYLTVAQCYRTGELSCTATTSLGLRPRTLVACAEQPTPRLGARGDYDLSLLLFAVLWVVLFTRVSPLAALLASVRVSAESACREVVRLPLTRPRSTTVFTPDLGSLALARALCSEVRGRGDGESGVL